MAIPAATSEATLVAMVSETSEAVLAAMASEATLEATTSAPQPRQVATGTRAAWVTQQAGKPPVVKLFPGP